MGAIVKHVLPSDYFMVCYGNHHFKICVYMNIHTYTHTLHGITFHYMTLHGIALHVITLLHTTYIGSSAINGRLLPWPTVGLPESALIASIAERCGSPE